MILFGQFCIIRKILVCELSKISSICMLFVKRNLQGEMLCMKNSDIGVKVNG